MIRRAIETIKTAEAIKTIEVIKRITVKQITKRCLPVLMAAAVLLPGMMEMTAGTCLEAFAQEVERIGPGGQTANVQEVKTQTSGNQVNPVPSNQISANAPASQVGGVNQAQNPVSVNNSGELKGVWISYLEWEKLPKGEAEFKQAVDGMMDNCVNWGLNAIFLHAHSHTDAMYPSQILPWSKFASGVQGVSPGYDPFGYFVEAAHARGLQVHAWFNPYRVTGYHMSWDDVSPYGPVKQWLTDDTTANDRYVLLHDGEYYLNPASPEVRVFLALTVREVLEKYPIEGVHFDDYFYPNVKDDDPARWFDWPEYAASGSTLSIADWRRENVSQLVSLVYQTVKAVRPDAVFGVSPQGVIGNLRSNTGMYVDIDRWLSSEGMVDYIMPQLYWGFEAKTSSKQPASHAFAPNLNSWITLKNKGNVKLYLGLGLYRAGTNVADHNDVSEWLRYNDIMKRQVEMARATGQVSGFCFFSYSSFLEATSAAEVQNLLPLLKQ